MGLMRSLLLAGSDSRWLRAQATRRAFVRRAVSRFMPGETLAEAMGTADGLRPDGIGLVLTRLGENVTDAAEADEVFAHYMDALDRVGNQAVPGGPAVKAEISVKPTQLGLD